MTIIARSDFPPNTIQELAEYVKRTRTRSRWPTPASAPPATVRHHAGRSPGRATADHPHKGTAPAMNDLLGNRWICSATRPPTPPSRSMPARSRPTPSPACNACPRCPSCPPWTNPASRDSRSASGMACGAEGHAQARGRQAHQSLQAGLADPKFQDRMKQLGATVLTKEAIRRRWTPRSQQVPQWAELFKKAGVEQHKPRDPRRKPFRRKGAFAGR